MVPLHELKLNEDKPNNQTQYADYAIHQSLLRHQYQDEIS